MSIEFKRTERSNILVHWTGKDIDKNDPRMQETKIVRWRKFPLRPIERPSLIKKKEVIDDYIKRLRDILKFGLWMRNDELLSRREIKGCSREDGRIKNTSGIARVCFTELKLSEARQHAYEYGRLGIGIKKMFLSNRAGQPMVYASPIKEYHKPNWFLDSIAEQDKDNLLYKQAQTSFFKYASELEDLSYKYQAEAEWRIVYPEGLDRSKGIGKMICRKFINMAGNPCEEFKKYKIGTCELQEFKDYIKINKSKGLKYLIPVDFWLSVIIYPCPAVKIASERNVEIRELLQKTRLPLHQQLTEIVVGEKYMLPIEVDLDTMSHF
jgi:hypothetical protein